MHQGPKDLSSPFELTPALVEALLPKSQLALVPKDGVIFRQGESCRGAFIIRSGSCRIVMYAEDGSEVYERTLSPRCILGLPATLCGQTYNSSAVALQDSELALIDSASFQEFVRSRPDLSMVVVQLMGRELAEMNLRRANLSTCRACGCPLAEACSHHLLNP